MAKRKRYKYDVFISHAVEDKLAIANELSEALEKTGLKVWYSGRELSVGDRLIETIHTGLDECRFGVVILSPTYLGKIWALNEFFTLIHREKEGQKVVLPVLYDITPEELGARYPAMADIFAVRASRGIDHVTSILHNEIKKIQNREPVGLVEKASQPWNKRTLLWIAMMLLVLSSIYGITQFIGGVTPSANVASAIAARISDVQKEADQVVQQLKAGNGRKATATEIKKVYADFLTVQSYYRNEYALNTGDQLIRSKRNVEVALAMDMETITPLNQYSFTSPQIFRSTSSSPGEEKEQYVFFNTQPVTYKIESSHEEEDLFKVKVSYNQPIRLVYTVLDFPSSVKNTKRHQMSITALRPVETYSFQKEGEQWVLKSVE